MLIQNTSINEWGTILKIHKEQYLGIALVVVVTIISQVLAIFIPSVGAESIAMILGIILGNTLFSHKKYTSGIKWSEKYPIEISIALLGGTLTLTTLTNVGLRGIAFAVINMAIIITTAYLLGRLIFKADIKSSLLMSAGNAVCGSSAIAGVSPVIGATDDQRRTTIATVSLTGMLLLFTMPTVAPVLLAHDNFKMGAIVGGTLQSVGQVLGTASLINASVVTYATLFKVIRVMLLVVVVMLFAHFAKSRGITDVDVEKKPSVLPWYIVAFIFLIIVNSLFKLPVYIEQPVRFSSSFLGIVNLAAIGLNLKWETIKNSGAKVLSYGFLVGLIQVIVALVLIKCVL